MDQGTSDWIVGLTRRRSDSGVLACRELVDNFPVFSLLC